MADELPKCPECSSIYTYVDGLFFVCPECAHEWSQDDIDNDDDAIIVKDSNGNLLQEGDTVTVIKDLKVKGSSTVIKVGTKIKNIHLVEGDHPLDCKIDKFGQMMLTAKVVKKV